MCRSTSVRRHMLPKSKALGDLLNRESTEIVDLARIDTRIFILPREVSNCTSYRLRSQAPSLKLQRQRAEVIVVDGNEPRKLSG